MFDPYRISMPFPLLPLGSACFGNRSHSRLRGWEFAFFLCSFFHHHHQIARLHRQRLDMTKLVV